MANNETVEVPVEEIKALFHRLRNQWDITAGENREMAEQVENWLP